MRRLIVVALSIGLATGPVSAAPLWDTLSDYRIGRYGFVLPAGVAWDMRGGGDWYNVSALIRQDGTELFYWVGVEVSPYPESRYDWTEAENAREIRDYQALRLIQTSETSATPLEILTHGQAEYSGMTAYTLKWGWEVYVPEIGRRVPERQMLTVFLAPDSARDFSYLAVYFGVECLSACSEDEMDLEVLRPVLDRITIEPAD